MPGATINKHTHTHHYHWIIMQSIVLSVVKVKTNNCLMGRFFPHSSNCLLEAWVREQSGYFLESFKTASSLRY